MANATDYAPTYPHEAYMILVPSEQDALKQWLHSVPGPSRLEDMARAMKIGTEPLLLAIAGQRVRTGTAALIRQWLTLTSTERLMIVAERRAERAT